MIKRREIARILNRFGFGICTAKEREMLDVRNPLDFKHFIQFHISRSDPDSFFKIETVAFEFSEYYPLFVIEI